MSGTLAELEEAFRKYKARMLASNRAFWTGKIHALEQDSSLTDSQRLDILARYLDMGKWSRLGLGSTITRPSQILIPPGQPGYIDLGIDRDGTIPPAPEEKVNTFLDNLKDSLNQIFPDQSLEIPEEYRHLLRFTDSLTERDFRQSGEAPLNGTCGRLPSRHAFSDMASGRQDWREDGWTVVGGWKAGIGYMSETWLLYARKDGGTPSEQQLAWRVWDFDSSCMIDGRWFESIVAYMLFKCDWLNRLPAGWENHRPDFPVDELSESEMDEDEDPDGDASEDDKPSSDDDWPDFKYQAFDCVHDIMPRDGSETSELDESLARLSLEDRLSKAIKDFESKQQDAVQQWLRARLRKIEETSASDPTESKESLERLAGSFGFSSWSALASEHKLSAPQELLTLWPEVASRYTSTRPPVSDEERSDFLKRLTDGVNQVYDPNAADFHLVPLPKDYEVLLSITDGIRDNDLRGSGVAGADGVRDADIPKMAPDDTDKLPWVCDLWSLGWEISTGFLLGLGKKRNEQWLSYYYCARMDTTSKGPRMFRKDEIKDNEREWQWRLFYAEPKPTGHAPNWPVICSGIVEWLRYYQLWWDRETKEYPEMAAKVEEGHRMARKYLYPRKRAKLDPEQQGDRTRPEANEDVDTAGLFEGQEE
jgi:hypothetical protein